METRMFKPSLSTFVTPFFVLLLFAGRWGLDFDSHSQVFKNYGSILYGFVFELRWWIICLLSLVIVYDYTRLGITRQMRRSPFLGVAVIQILFFTLLASAAFTDGTNATVEKVFDIIGLSVTVVLLNYVAIRKSGSDTQLQENTLIFCFLIGTGISCIALLTADLNQRATVAGGGPNTFVRIVGVSAISCIGIKRIPQVLSFAASAGYLLLIILTQSRGGLSAFACAILLQYIWCFGWRSKFSYGLIGLATVGAGAHFTPTGQRCLEIIEDRVFSQTFTYNYTAGRDDLYTESWHIWEDNFLFGVGLNNWWDSLGNYPHNIFLELGCDCGLIGVVLFMLLIAIYFVNALRCQTLASKSVACITLFYFIAAQFSGDLYDSRGLFFFGTLLCTNPIEGGKSARNQAEKLRGNKSKSVISSNTSLKRHKSLSGSI